MRNFKVKDKTKTFFDEARIKKKQKDKWVFGDFESSETGRLLDELKKHDESMAHEIS